MDNVTFEQIDTNNDGLLSFEEIQQALSNPNLPEKTIRALFEAFDVNEDGFISREEAMQKIVQVPAGKEKLVEEFKALDVNGDGVLTFDEFYEGMKEQMSCEEIENIYRQLDKDNDEAITLDEFIMSQILLCHSSIRSSQANIDRSTACLTEVIQNLCVSENMDACSKMLQEARKRQLILTWPSKKRQYKRTPFAEYKNMVSHVFQEASQGGLVLDQSGVTSALAKLGKYVDAAQVSKLAGQVGTEENAVDQQHFLAINLKLLAKEVKSKTQSRLSALSKPRTKVGELTVEDYLQQEAETKAKQQDQSNKKTSKPLTRRLSTTSSMNMKIYPL
eukprot:746367-Hanusia_phi.AAC.3